MEMSESVFDGAFALVLLLTLDWGIWWQVKMYLSMDYEGEFDVWAIRRDFPNRRPFKIIKLGLGFSIVSLLVMTMHLGAAEHLGLAVTTLAAVAVFGIVSGWESFKAFRYFASHHLTPRPRGGYRGL